MSMLDFIKEYEEKDPVLKELGEKLDKAWRKKHELEQKFRQAEDEYDEIYNKFFERLNKDRVEMLK